MILIEVWGDGSCKNTGTKDSSMGIGVVIKVDGKLVKEVYDFAGYGTSSLSEWEAFVLGIREAVKVSYNVCERAEIRYYADSQMVVKQFNGDYSNKHFKAHNERVVFWMGCMRSMDRLVVKWIPREENKHADKLSKKGNPFSRKGIKHGKAI